MFSYIHIYIYMDGVQMTVYVSKNPNQNYIVL